jgi:hypothetical protein
MDEGKFLLYSKLRKCSLNIVCQAHDEDIAAFATDANSFVSTFQHCHLEECTSYLFISRSVIANQFTCIAPILILNSTTTFCRHRKNGGLACQRSSFRRSYDVAHRFLARREADCFRLFGSWHPSVGCRDRPTFQLCDVITDRREKSYTGDLKFDCGPLVTWVYQN